MHKCGMCGTTAALVKAHVIPEAFFRPLREDGQTPLLVSNASEVQVKRSPIGVYDRELLCAFCEAKFSPADSYGAKVLIADFDRYFVPVQNADKTVAYEGLAVNKQQLLEFLVSILWRASASSNPFFNRVHLGIHEKEAKDSLFAAPTLIPSLFDAVLSRWREADVSEIPTNALLNPHRERWDGVNAYRLYLGKTVAYVKVDQRRFAEPFASISLQGPAPCRLITRELATSNDIEAMRKTAVAAATNRRKKTRAQQRGDSVGHSPSRPS